jgi:hypothetical protein
VNGNRLVHAGESTSKHNVPHCITHDSTSISHPSGSLQGVSGLRAQLAPFRSRCPVDPAVADRRFIKWATIPVHRGVRTRRRQHRSDMKIPVEPAGQHLPRLRNSPRCMLLGATEEAGLIFRFWALDQAHMPKYLREGRRSRRGKPASWRRREWLGLRRGRGVSRRNMLMADIW